MSDDRTRYPESKAGGNTLLAQLGFADRDRANPRHDLAVSYAAANADKLRARLTAWLGNDKSYSYERSHHDQHRPMFLIEQKVSRPDLRDSRAASPFLIGFADAIFSWDGFLAILEVKISPCSAGDVIRQIEAYRGGVAFSTSPGNPGGWLAMAPAVLLCDFTISPSEKSALESKRILPMRLGPDFETYAAQQVQSEAELEAF